MLFDHDNDPRECHDLSELPEHQETRNRMRNALRDHLAKHGDKHVVDGELNRSSGEMASRRRTLRRQGHA